MILNKGPSGTSGQTTMAIDALIRYPFHFRIRREGFRIMAPGAGKITAFKKDGGSNSRPIVN